MIEEIDKAIAGVTARIRECSRECDNAVLWSTALLNLTTSRKLLFESKQLEEQASSRAAVN